MKRWIALGLAGSLLCVAPWVLRRSHGPIATPAAGSAETDDDEALTKAKLAERGFEKTVTPPALTGVDLLRVNVGDNGVTAPAHGERVAHLTLDPVLQRFAERLLKNAAAAEASVVMTDLTGRVLVWASQREGKGNHNGCVEASAPAASIFKLVTATALVEQAGLTPDTNQCYWGGEHRLEAANLVDNPRRDKWCATLAEAMGRSLNTVFARLAVKHLDARSLTTTAHALGFGERTPFDVSVAPSTLEVPDDTLGFARTSAGFWNSTLSPLEGAALALTFANRGLTVRPYVVDEVTEGSTVLFRAPRRQVGKRAMKPETADAVTRMLATTVTNGTCHRAFHDGAGRPFLPNIAVAGKTGTLARPDADQLYTWFVGFAPTKSPEVVLSVLVVNGANWKVKANGVARDLLRAYFAGKHAPGVTLPSKG